MVDIIVPAGVVTFVVAFWGWVRKDIIDLRSRLAVIEAEVVVIKERCVERREDFKEVFSRLEEHMSQLAVVTERVKAIGENRPPGVQT